MIRHKNRDGGPDFAKFTVNFPVSREFGAETGSQLTASSASQSSLHELTYGYRSTSRHRGVSQIWLGLHARKVAAEWPLRAPVSKAIFFWRLVFDRALKTLGWFSCKTRRYSCVLLSLAPDRSAQRWGEPGSSMARMWFGEYAIPPIRNMRRYPRSASKRQRQPSNRPRSW